MYEKLLLDSLKTFTRDNNMDASWTEYWDHDHDHDCPTCEDYEKRLISAKDYYEGIFDILAHKEQYDAKKLENCMEELAHVLKSDVNMFDLKLIEDVPA